MIISKAHGQSIKEVGIDLRQEYYSHTVCNLLRSWFCKRLTYTVAHREKKKKISVL
jgi:hypothetical protein